MVRHNESQEPGAADATTGGRSLAERFRRHADALIHDGRSPLSAALMHGAADDLDASGTVARLFVGVPALPGSVPQLRLLAALHHLVLSGRAPKLARFYPSAGGKQAPEGVWATAREVVEDHFDWIRARLYLTVQTNEPGRCTVLYPALLWLSSRFGLPVRLLELGASAGLNLIPERYCYLVSSQALGEVSSSVRFSDPWDPGPPIDLRAAAEQLRIAVRAGCDRRPLDPGDPEDRIALLSYIWPDESARIERMRAALAMAPRFVPPVDRRPAGDWISGALRARRPGELTVVWHSLFRQYVEPEEWAAIEGSVRDAVTTDPSQPTVWLRMEPGHDHLRRVTLTLLERGDEAEKPLAECGDHGPPVRWLS